MFKPAFWLIDWWWLYSLWSFWTPANHVCCLFNKLLVKFFFFHRASFKTLLHTFAEADMPHKKLTLLPQQHHIHLLYVQKKLILVLMLDVRNMTSWWMRLNEAKEKHSRVKFPIHRRSCSSLIVCSGCCCQGVRVGTQWEALRLTPPPAGRTHPYACYGAAWCQLRQTGRKKKRFSYANILRVGGDRICAYYCCQKN